MLYVLLKITHLPFCKYLLSLVFVLYFFRFYIYLLELYMGRG